MDWAPRLCISFGYKLEDPWSAVLLVTLFLVLPCLPVTYNRFLELCTGRQHYILDNIHFYYQACSAANCDKTTVEELNNLDKMGEMMKEKTRKDKVLLIVDKDSMNLTMLSPTRAF